VFPVRYELDFYILFRINLVFKGLMTLDKLLGLCNVKWCAEINKRW
jgi:hypothetical protein